MDGRRLYEIAIDLAEVCGGLAVLVLAVAYGLAILGRRYGGTDNKLVIPKRPVPRFEGHDEALRLRTEARRKAADGIRRRAASVESGAKVSDVLRVVKRG